MKTSIYKVARAAKSFLKKCSIKLCLLVPFGPEIYYLFNREFAAEHRAVLLAKLLHQEAGMSGEYTKAQEYRLRRNIHRLEKGLIMKPRRSVFALDYIGETIKTMAALISCDSFDDGLAKWATDVLDSYFACVDREQPQIAKAYTEYALLKTRDFRTDECCVPKPIEDFGTVAALSFESFLGLARRRKSVRWFEARRVGRTELDNAIAAAALSPSACNRQPFRFAVFDNPEDAHLVGSIPFGTAGFSHQFPCVVVVIADIGAYFHEKDRHVAFVDAALASMTLQYGLVSQGLGTCCINWPDIRSQDAKMRKLLKLSATERIVMLIAVGYPERNAEVPYSQKKNLMSLRSYPPSQATTA